MRPPHYTGENESMCGGSFASTFCFNEAPALHGGKPRRGRTPLRLPRGFNEAPALHGGKPPGTAYTVEIRALLQ